MPRTSIGYDTPITTTNEWALRKEFSGDTTTPSKSPTRGIMTIPDLDPRRNPEEQKIRGRRANLETLKTLEHY